MKGGGDVDSANEEKGTDREKKKQRKETKKKYDQFTALSERNNVDLVPAYWDYGSFIGSANHQG